MKHRVSSATRESYGHRSLSAIDWQAESNLLASSQSSIVTLYHLAGNDQGVIKAAASTDTADSTANDETAECRNVKFLSDDLIAFGLTGSRKPLRLGRVTPTGLQVTDIASASMDLERLSLNHDQSQSDIKTAVRAIQPVGASHQTSNLLLSAWDDGTYRYVIHE